MRSTLFPADTDLRHLGVLVGNPDADRIIAVSTSAVFRDSSLLPTYWGRDGTVIDGGYQGHMYTRPTDVQVVRVPANGDDVPRMVLTATAVNHDIWSSLTGIKLAPATGQIVMASDQSPPRSLPANVTWHRGSLLEAAVGRFRDHGEALLAFVPDTRLAELLSAAEQGCEALMKQAASTSRLMDKNVAMQVLQDNGVDSARTYAVDEHIALSQALGRIPESGRYVFKPAGGAAGIGLYGHRGGAPLDLIRAHIDGLTRSGRLPRRFQIQEFLPGTPYGVTAYFRGHGSFDILEVHRQVIDDAGRFMGGRWTPGIQDEQMPAAYGLCTQLAAIEQPTLMGLVCLDFICARVIEVNPRLTASAPIAHLLQREDQIAHHLGRAFRTAQIDLNSRVRIPYESVRSGKLRDVTHETWRESGVLALPQGINPFGDSRLVFVNDYDETAQRIFVERIAEQRRLFRLRGGERDPPVDVNVPRIPTLHAPVGGRVDAEVAGPLEEVDSLVPLGP